MDKLGSTTKFLVAMLFAIYLFTMFPDVKSQSEEMVPVEVEGSLVKFHHLAAAAPTAGGGAKPYQKCSTCKCCHPDDSTCAVMPCCYGTKCDIPGKPAGYCVIVPLACNCKGCESEAPTPL